MPLKDLEKRREYNKLAQRRHYEKKKDYYKQKSAERRKKLKEFIDEYRKQGKCKCGEDHPAVLDFHHRDPKEKEICIDKICAHGWSLDKIKKELAKCDIICSNCHRKLHWGARSRSLTSL